jgi:outer membrane biosynthesis protein TonB
MSTNLVNQLRDGMLDNLFKGASHTPSELFRLTQNVTTGPSVIFTNTSTFAPASYQLPAYPPLARLAHLAGQVQVTLDVTPDGTVSNPRFHGGHVLLQKAVESALPGWSFSKEAAGREFQALVEFKLNCSSLSRQ